MSKEIWFVIHLLAVRMESQYPSRNKLKVLIKELAQAGDEDRKATLQDVEFVYLSLSELRTLIRETGLM